MNEFYSKIKEAFSRYQCCLYDVNEITLTPKHYLDFGLHRDITSTFKIETIIEEIGEFLQKNTCPYEHMGIKFKILIKDRFKEYNCYGFLITRTGIDDVGHGNILIKDFDKNSIIAKIMKDVNKETFMHVADVDIMFR